MQGLSQAQEISTKFGIPANVLPRVLGSGYMRVVKSLITTAAAAPPSHLPALTKTHSVQTSSGMPQAPAGSAAGVLSVMGPPNWESLPAASVTTSSAAVPSPMHTMHGVAPAGTPAASQQDTGATPPVGSQEWISQLERIREVCQKAEVDHSLIDGFLAASGAPQPLQQPKMDAFVPLTAALAASLMSETPYGAENCEKLEVEEPLGEVFGTGDPESLDFDVQEVLMDTDMVGDDVLAAGWAP